jgi:PAS domain S-box-containing protein
MLLFFLISLLLCCAALLAGCVLLHQRWRGQQLAAARQSQALQDFLAIASDWFWELDTDGRIVRCSAALQPLLGFAPASLHGLHWAQLQATQGSPDSACQLAALLAAGQPFRNQVFQLHCPDGVPRHISLSAMPLHDAAGRLCGYRGCGRDVTEYKQLEATLRQGQAGLSQSLSAQALALMDAKLAAENASQAKSRLLANVSHELLTPLHAILSFAEMGRLKLARGDTARVAEHLANIGDSGQRLLYQLNGLIDLAALETGKRPFHWQSLNLRLLVEDCLAQHDEALQQHGVQVDIRSHPLPRLVADHGSLAQLLGHVLDNAIRFSPRGGRIAIDIDRLADCLQLSVHDQGPGVPPAEAQRLFEAFELGSAAACSGHAGLGLAICQRIAAAHGGHIALAQRSQGACFVLQLPFVARQLPDAACEAGGRQAVPAAL